MNYLLNKHNARLVGEVNLTASKSESNRALLINALSEGKATLKNLSEAQDTEIMHFLLRRNPKVWDVIDAGTTMRFLTAYLAVRGEEKIITGSKRMCERPIGPLVDALTEIGAKIEYLGEKGYPPMRISRFEKQLTNKIAIPGNVSSQYISALLMIAPCLPKGLQLELTDGIFSKPYITLTLDLMRTFGVESKWVGNKITIKKTPYEPNEYLVEGDWSGASYWYGFMATSHDELSSLSISNLRTYSSQGDKRIAQIMFELGVVTEFQYGRIRLTKKEIELDKLELDMKDCPDIAQTVMVVAAMKGIEIKFTGLESLKIKETDRISAMKNELNKLGADLTENGSSWHLTPSTSLPDSMELDTYNDHRMAMAFAPVCHSMDLIVREPGVVRKSYPEFWEEVKSVGVKISPH